jgi:hypothetical protein
MGFLNRRAKARKSNEDGRAEAQRTRRKRIPLETEELLKIRISIQRVTGKGKFRLPLDDQVQLHPIRHGLPPKRLLSHIWLRE